VLYYAGIVLVDAFCKYLGLYVAKEVNRRGFACVQVLSDHLLSIMGDDSVASFAAPEQARKSNSIMYIYFCCAAEHAIRAAI
jgi:hypothetical protein